MTMVEHACRMDMSAAEFGGNIVKGAEAFAPKSWPVGTKQTRIRLLPISPHPLHPQDIAAVDYSIPSPRIRSSGSATKMPKPPAAAADDDDRFTALPLELRAQIASFLPFPEVARLAVLSRPWRSIHLRTPVVDLDVFLYFGDLVSHRTTLPGLLDDDALLGLDYSAGDPRIRRHADRIIALADASEVVLSVRYPIFGARPRPAAAAWALDVPPSTRYLELHWNDYDLAPAIAGPGAAALREMELDNIEELRRWPHLPSLRDLTLTSVNVKGPFAPAACFPLLENLCMCTANIEHPRVDILLPALKILHMDDVNVSLPAGDLGRGGDDDGDDPCYGDIAVDAPQLEVLVVKGMPEWTVEYKSFTLRAPRLRRLSWCCQYAERVAIDVGWLGGVSKGKIQFVSNGERQQPYSRDMKYYRAQMLQMLQGLLPDLPPETVADVARPYMTYTVEAEGMIPEERLTCNLTALMSTRTR
ncbi:unnamed protein product [Urochloa decumbens]|uniref:F-box domain-containing protein n=1 Tax=Urochloa decumbens TaxID=240449 RepID=A0ABC9GVL6_9POAL